MEKENKREEKVFYAHTSSHGNEPLEDHLRLVGDLAETFGADFESSKITKTIGNAVKNPVKLSPSTIIILLYNINMIDYYTLNFI